MRKPNQHEHKRLPGKPTLWRSSFGFMQVCRTIRNELLPLFRTQTVVYVEPEDACEYIETFLTVPGRSEEQVVGSVIMDIAGDAFPRYSTCTDIKPLLRLLRTAKGLYVGAHGITYDDELDKTNRFPPPSIQEILIHLYDIIDLEAFYDYVEKAMTQLEIESDDMKGVEIVFELGPGYWEDWMGVWSNPDHDPHYRIPLEQGDMVVQWGRSCGMELNRAAGSHLTVNFRQGMKAYR